MTFKLYNLSSKLFQKIIKEKCNYKRHYTVKNTYKVLFFGSDSIGFSSLKKINELRNIEKIITKLDLVTANNTKTKTVIEKYANSQNINLIQWPLRDIQIGEYDIGLIVAFGHLIKEDVLSKFPLGMINVHPSILPRWRGAAPIVHTLLHGDEITGVSLMKIKANVFDVGEIVSQRLVPVSKDIKLPELTKQLSEIGADMLAECMRNLPQSLASTKPQSEQGVTFAKKINKSISIVRWSVMTALDVYNLYRAIYGIYQLTTTFRNNQMKLFGAFLHNEHLESKNKSIGTLEYCEETNAIRVLCKDRRYIYFRSLRIVGKKEITALDFYNGYIKNASVDNRFIVVG